MKARTALFVSALLYSMHSFAMFCPTNFNQMNIGDTVAQVEAQCGKPTSEKKSQSLANVPQEWTYYIAISNNLKNFGLGDNNQGTVKLTFAFVNDKIVNISSNGAGLSTTNLCNNIQLQIGNTISDVEKTCGKPAMVTQTNSNLSQNVVQGPNSAPTEMLEWTYAPATGSPGGTTVLIFENGKLKSRK